MNGQIRGHREEEENAAHVGDEPGDFRRRKPPPSLYTSFCFLSFRLHLVAQLVGLSHPDYLDWLSHLVAADAGTRHQYGQRPCLGVEDVVRVADRTPSPGN